MLNTLKSYTKDFSMLSKLYSFFEYLIKRLGLHINQFCFASVTGPSCTTVVSNKNF